MKIVLHDLWWYLIFCWSKYHLVDYIWVAENTVDQFFILNVEAFGFVGDLFRLKNVLHATLVTTKLNYFGNTNGNPYRKF